MLRSKRFATAISGACVAASMSKLLHSVCSDTPWQSVAPPPPLFLFKPSGGDLQHSCESFLSLPEIMPVYSMGIKPGRDNLAVDFEAAPILERIERFRSARSSDADLCEELAIALKKGWNVGKAQRICEL